MMLAGVYPDLMPLSLMQGVESFSRLAAASVVSGLWQGVALAAGAALCLRLVPKTTAALRFTVWTGVFAVLALLPLLHTYAWRGAGAGTGHGAMVQVDMRWSFVVGLLWLAMSVSRSVDLVRGAVRLRSIWKRAVPVEADQRSSAALAKAGLRGAQLCTSADVDRPSVIGFFSPRVLIPEELFGRLSSEELEQIVLHEVGHLRRADDWMNLLQKLSLVLIPLNPALVWIERRLCFERELACDDEVLQLTRAPKAYATCLTNLAEHRLGRQAMSLSLGAWERQSELGRRVHRILRHGETMSRRQAQVVVGGLTIVLLAGATELSRCPQLVSFARGTEVHEALSEPSRSLPAAAAYQPAVFRPEAPAFGRQGAAHETLLKASMPLPDTARPAAPVRSPRKQTKQRRAAAVHQPKQWMVLTSWSGREGEQPRVILTVSGKEFGDQMFSSSYAAVPTATGWLVIQL